MGKLATMFREGKRYIKRNMAADVMKDILEYVCDDEFEVINYAWDFIWIQNGMLRGHSHIVPPGMQGFLATDLAAEVNKEKIYNGPRYVEKFLNGELAMINDVTIDEMRFIQNNIQMPPNQMGALGQAALWMDKGKLTHVGGISSFNVPLPRFKASEILKGLKNMPTDKKVRHLSHEDAKRIYAIACGEWKTRLLKKWGPAFLTDTVIHVNETEYKDMRKACTSGQHDLFDEIFGADEFMPIIDKFYKRKSDGVIMQVKAIEKSYKTISGPVIKNLTILSQEHWNPDMVELEEISKEEAIQAVRDILRKHSVYSGVGAGWITLG